MSLWRDWLRAERMRIALSSYRLWSSAKAHTHSRLTASSETAIVRAGRYPAIMPAPGDRRLSAAGTEKSHATDCTNAEFGMPCGQLRRYRVTHNRVGRLAWSWTRLLPACSIHIRSDRRATDARQWFQDAKLGLFVHWGVYSLLGKGEWVMENDKIPIREYAKLPPRFNPTRFDATAWVKLAKSSGAKYITVTAKHHDGFCMFASGLTDYDIADATPFRPDPLKALADACHQEKIKLFFYYSLLDWHHPDYLPMGKTGAKRRPRGQG